MTAAFTQSSYIYKFLYSLHTRKFRSVRPYAVYECHKHVYRKHGRAAVGHKRKRDSDNGQHRKAHTDIFNRLHEHDSADAYANKRAVVVTAGARKIEYAKHHYKQKYHYKQPHDRAHFFAHRRKDKVGV